MQKMKVLSEACSLKGWEFMKWLKGNFSTIKEIAKVGTPLVLAWLATANPFWTGLATLCGKFVLDLGEYFIKEYKE